MRARDQSLAALNQLRGQIQQAMEGLGYHDLDIRTIQELRANETNPLPVIALIFTAMALLVTLTGALGLVHNLTTSVLEHRLEIGILRSLGATGWKVGTVFWIGGLSLAIIAWSLGVVLGLPLGWALLQVLGLFFGPVDFAFHLLFLVITLAVILGVVGAASFGPALSASRLRLRESLRYE